jgi:hypothetical protein
MIERKHTYTLTISCYSPFILNSNRTNHSFNVFLELLFRAHYSHSCNIEHRRLLKHQFIVCRPRLKQTSVFRLQKTNGSLPFLFSVCSKQTELAIFVSSGLRMYILKQQHIYLCIYIDIYLHIYIYMYITIPFFFFICFWRTSGSFLIIFSSVAPHRGQPAAKCAIPGGNPPEDWQSAVGWGDTGFEPGTAGQQSGALPLSHHASYL